MKAIWGNKVGCFPKSFSCWEISSHITEARYKAVFRTSLSVAYRAAKGTTEKTLQLRLNLFGIEIKQRKPHDKSGCGFHKHFSIPCLLVAEVAGVEAGEAAAVASLVLGHFVNGVVDGVEVSLLGVGGDAHLVGVGAGFSHHALVEVGLGVPHAVTEELGELGGVLGLFPSVALEGFGDFGIPLAVGLTRHCQVHTDLGALTHEMGVEVLDHLGIAALGHADFVLGNELESLLGGQFLELRLGSAAERALFGSLVTFVNVAAHCADKFLCHCLFVSYVCVVSVGESL